ncbi:hypothetical protein FBF24_03525 [Candidatus Saccharibacteria bacterium oral taxon 488]|nr:hypothetical protein FBF24_03525 [Candidatus Saccharibacteria bacterium oral taxon 488]
MTFIKNFSDIEHLELELAGYDFFRQYYKRVPSIISINKKGLYIEYSDLCDTGNQTLFHILRSGTGIDMSEFFKDLSNLANTMGIWSHVEAGGTKIFYINRLHMIESPQLLKQYEEFCADESLKSVNDLSVYIRNDLLYMVKKYVKDMQKNMNNTYVIPSQGDVHDMNIFQNGYLVDFEAAGWNRLSTDISTFIHHIMCGGNHFGPLYAKWANPEPNPLNRSKEITYTDGRAWIRLNTSRQRIIRDYMEYYIKGIDKSILSKINREVCVMMSLRLLTVFNVAAMSPEDRSTIFILANYFFSHYTIEESVNSCCFSDDTF